MYSVPHERIQNLHYIARIEMAPKRDFEIFPCGYQQLTTVAAVTADGTVLISTIETLFRLNEAGPPTPVRAVVSGLAVVPPLPDRRS
jgi:hypothetical protein